MRRQQRPHLRRPWPPRSDSGAHHCSWPRPPPCHFRRYAPSVLGFNLQRLPRRRRRISCSSSNGAHLADSLANASKCVVVVAGAHSTDSIRRLSDDSARSECRRVRRCAAARSQCRPSQASSCCASATHVSTLTGGFVGVAVGYDVGVDVGVVAGGRQTVSERDKNSRQKQSSKECVAVVCRAVRRRCVIEFVDLKTFVHQRDVLHILGAPPACPRYRSAAGSSDPVSVELVGSSVGTVVG